MSKLFSYAAPYATFAHPTYSLHHMKYQPEVDGLRSLAILPVLAFHVGMPGVTGGFVGVDIFFVISGYLIASIIRDDLIAGRFSVLEFYKRRVLRILPALSVVLIAVFCVSVLVFLPAEIKDVGRSAIAATLFLSNVFFWRNSGYFDGPAEAKPLLHTWSLSVEEQFYIGFPILVAFLWRRFPTRLNAMLVLLVAISFAASVFGVYAAPSGTFYLLPTRAWELGIGACLALFPVPTLTRWRSLLSWVGLALITAAVLLLSSTSRFPGYNAMLPCVGAALIIGFSAGTPVGNALSRPIAVGIGKISYSLYLWHWPLIVFYKAKYGAILTGGDMVLIASASMFLAGLSYYVVEQPFRTNALRHRSSGMVVGAGASVMAAFSVVAFLLSIYGARIRDYSPAVVAASRLSEYRKTSDYAAQFQIGTCFLGQAQGSFDAYDKTRCLHVDPQRKNVLLIGDSHGAQIWRALQDQFTHVNFMQATSSGCRPLINGRGAKFCTDLVKYVTGNFLVHHKIDGVILAARWEEEELPLLAPTVRSLIDRGLDVVVFGPTVEYKGELPVLVGQSALNSRNFDPGAYLNGAKKALNDKIQASLADTGARYFSLYDQICSQGACKLHSSDGELMQFDYGHLTLTASRDVIARMAADRKNPLNFGDLTAPRRH